jgi:hypothetical protein
MKNISEEIYSDGTEITTSAPREAKGGTFAPSDIQLIKKVLMSYVSDSSLSLTPGEEQQAINLIHRLGRIS